MQNKIILGIDPGYGRIGIAVLEKSLRGEKLLHSECFETDSKLPQTKRLFLIEEKLRETIEEYQPKIMAVETLLWSKNKKTAMQVAEARGVIVAQASRYGLLLREFNPNRIKIAVTGYGKSDKRQIIQMIERLVKLPIKKDKKRLDDEYDAIATALTCSATALSTDFHDKNDCKKNPI